MYPSSGPQGETMRVAVDRLVTNTIWLTKWGREITYYPCTYFPKASNVTNILCMLLEKSAQRSDYVLYPSFSNVTGDLGCPT